MQVPWLMAGDGGPDLSLGEQCVLICVSWHGMGFVSFLGEYGLAVTQAMRKSNAYSLSISSPESPLLR